ncbi:outer membrane protein assembly factor BamD [Flavobacterium seoulense]|uniref:Outer membrane assembly lipoprotein YfiO n=1 Tax=Flavobacterium seoulense TaxID=1492738 RepID=A0A066WRK5_9FLAO|nr:outer membrane protein assembly factor BamD [Flavobacterium seoulense]KDN56406.1 outer membrane assembly lipoprotein YfiO [Flavobacterium seoulense]
MKKIVSLLLLVVLFSSCNEYQKALKSEDVSVKFAMADTLYAQAKYSKALRLFEQIAPEFRGKPQAEKLFYMYAQSYYKTKQYYLAAYQFESFVSGYPRSVKIQEASFLGAKSYAILSPTYSLDQADTYKAIEKLQAFIDRFPNSDYLAEANSLTKSLSEKIELKVFENAKSYNTISDFKSAIVAFDNFIIDYPGTKFKEDALFYKFDSAYKLGINSVPDKMQDRLNVAKTSYQNLIKFKSDTKYKEKVDEMYARVEQELQKYTK